MLLCQEPRWNNQGEISTTSASLQIKVGVVVLVDKFQNLQGT